MYSHVRRHLAMSFLSVLMLLPATGLLFAGDNTVDGTGSVNSFYGSFSTEIPIAVPAYHGIEPSLKLVYGSGGGDTWVGHAWNLAGLSFIERGLPGGGAPKYNSGDAYFLEGTEMVPCTSQGGTHCPEIQNYSRITLSNDIWTVVGTNGNVATYSQKQTTSKGTFRWYLKKLTDPRGNTVNYNYVNGSYGEVYLNTITYNGNTVTFHRVTRSDLISYANGDGIGKVNQLLKAISVKVGSSMVRAYALTHDSPGLTDRSRLKKVQQFGRNAVVSGSGTVTGTSLPAYQMGYADEPTDWGGEKSWGTYLKSQASGGPFASYADLNGDGMDDFFYRKKDSKELRVMLSNGNGFGSDTIWGYTTYNTGNSDPTFTLTDMNGDGKADLIYRRKDKRDLRVLLSTGSSFGTDTLWGTYSYSVGNSHPKSSFTDMNGDGLTDFVYRRKDTKTIRVMLNNGSSLGADTYWGAYSQSPATGDWPKAAWVDLNGDGKSDFIYRKGGQRQLYAMLSTGTSLASESLWGTYTYNVGQAEPNTAFVDLNGDGKADFLYKKKDSRYMYAMLSNGNGFEPQTYWGYMTYKAASGQLDARFADINGDRKIDLVYRHKDTRNLRVLLSNGINFETDRLWATYSYNVGNSAPHVALGDFNGDGRTDYLYRRKDTKNLRVRASRAGEHGLMTSVQNGTGGSTNITYTPSSEWNNTMMPAGLILQTVTRLEINDGRGNTSLNDYTYEGGLWSNEDRRFLGFRKATTVLDAQGNYAETWYYQRIGSISKPEYSYMKNNQGKIYHYTAYEYTENTSAPYTSLLTERWTYDLNLGTQSRISLTQFQYDTYGNVTRVYEHGDYNVTGDERSTIRGYYPNNSKYIAGLPAYEQLRAGIGGAGSLKKLTYFYYDNNGSWASAPSKGLLTKSRKWDNKTGSYKNATMTYDAYGNVISQTNERGAVTTTAFDSTYRVYPVSATNAAGHTTTSTWDYVLGLELSNTDPNGAVTRFSYDNLGRTTAVTYPGNRTTTYSYLNWGNASLQRVKETKPDGSSNGLWKETWYDGLGRIWYVTTEGGISQETEFVGATTRIRKKSFPRFSSESVKWTQYTYDGVGRRRTVTHPDGSMSETIYANDGSGKPYQAHYDENGLQKLTWTDPYGRLIQVREKNGSSYYYTNYQYDLAGNLTRTIDHNGNTTTLTWDSLGNKTAGCDPDQGCRTYTYDNGGLPLTETDAMGQTSTFTYDGLGRMRTRTDADGNVSRWYYDEAGYGYSKGRLTRMTSPWVSEEHYWNIQGQQTETTRCVLGVCKTFETSYDLIGRVDDVTYPDGEVVSYNYDSRGNLYSIPGYVNSMVWDARGQLTSMTYANGTTNTYTYDANRLSLTNALVKKGSATRYQASYSYDDGGRVTNSSSSTHSMLNLNYTYDGINRLKTISGGQSESYSYDALGNMTYKTGVGSYVYGNAAHKHAASKAGSKNLSYDANGSLLSDGSRSFTWNSSNLLESVTQSGNTTSYGYDAGGQRVAMVAPNRTTLYFGSLAEETDGELINYIMAGPMLVARNDDSGKTWYHADRLGSIRLMTNASGNEVRSYEYNPYGDVIAQSGSKANTRGFTGHTLDEETGLIYMNARYYDPELGRFISADTVVPEPGNPQALNRYSYVYNNPVLSVDPTGHGVVVAALAAVSASLAATAAGAGSWVAITATIGAGLSIAGYYTKNPWLSTIGSVLMGISGTFAVTGSLTQAAIGGAVNLATSPVSPLGDGLKKAISYAWTAYGMIRGMGAESGEEALEAPKGFDAGDPLEVLEGGRAAVYPGQGPYKAIIKVTGVSTGEAGSALGNLPANIRDIVTNLRGELTPTAQAIQDFMTKNGYQAHEVLGIGHSLGSWDLIQLANNAKITNVIGFGVPHEALVQVIHGNQPANMKMSLAVGWADYVALPRVPTAVGNAFAGTAAKAGVTNGLNFGVVNTGIGFGAHMTPAYQEAVPSLLGR